MYHLMLSRCGVLDACVLRLTNVYGPRLSLEAPDQGVFSAFLRRLVRGERLQVFGDGTQLRDPVYVEDVVEAFLLAGAVERLHSRSYNLASQ
jgi:nucleoside-diphosphate-sugar epimerase